MKKTGRNKRCAALAVLLALGLSGSAFAGEEIPEIRVTALKGPTAMGMVALMDQADQGNIADYDYQFTIAASADEVTPQLVQGKTDMAAVPANLASVLYNHTDGAVEVLAINTLGVLYIVESGDTVSSAADLKGKTIYASGKGSTPEYALNYVLKQNGLVPGTDVLFCHCLTSFFPKGIRRGRSDTEKASQRQNSAVRSRSSTRTDPACSDTPSPDTAVPQWNYPECR